MVELACHVSKCGIFVASFVDPCLKCSGNREDENRRGATHYNGKKVNVPRFGGKGFVETVLKGEPGSAGV
jgi:hypothetical protein